MRCEPSSVRSEKRLEQAAGFIQELVTFLFSHTVTLEPPIWMRAELMFGPEENEEEKGHGVFVYREVKTCGPKPT